MINSLWFLEKIIEKAVKHQWTGYDDEPKGRTLTKSLACIMMDTSRLNNIGLPTNFYIPPRIVVDSAYKHICGISFTYVPELAYGEKLYKYYVDKGGKILADHYFFIASNCQDGTIGYIKHEPTQT